MSPVLRTPCRGLIRSQNGILTQNTLPGAVKLPGANNFVWHCHFSTPREEGDN
ncbi:MAG: hypothetical protein NTV33_04580 [Coprothermobacterota bacterium]|nr:hypothetical protein [Coprothermobacterota bacterium]